MLETIFINLNNYSPAIAAVSVIAGGVWAFLKFSEYIKDKRFNNYHRLIKELVDGETPDVVLRLDRQIAILFELRNYPSYYEVTQRILVGLKEGGWDRYSQRLGVEIDLTLQHIRKSSVLKARHWIIERIDSLLIILGLILQTKGALLLSDAVFPTGVKTGNTNWSTHLTGFNDDIYQLGIKFLIIGFIIQVFPLIYKILRK